MEIYKSWFYITFSAEKSLKAAASQNVCKLNVKLKANANPMQKKSKLDILVIFCTKTDEESRFIN